MRLDADPDVFGVGLNQKVVTTRRLDATGFEVRAIDTWNVVKASARRDVHIWSRSDCILIGESRPDGYQLSLLNDDTSHTLWRSDLIAPDGTALQSRYRLGWTTRNDRPDRGRTVFASPEATDRAIYVWCEESSGSERVVKLDRSDGTPLAGVEVEELIDIWSADDTLALVEGFGENRKIRLISESSMSPIRRIEIGKGGNARLVGQLVVVTVDHGYGHGPTLSLVDARTGGETRTVACGPNSHILALKPISRIAYADPFGCVQVAGLESTEEVAHGRLVFGNSKTLVIENEHGLLTGYRTLDGAATWEHDGPYGGVEMHSHLSGEERLVMRQGRSLTWLDSSTGETLLLNETDGSGGCIEASSDCVAIIESDAGFEAVRGRTSPRAALASAVRQIVRQRQAVLRGPAKAEIERERD